MIKRAAIIGAAFAGMAAGDALAAAGVDVEIYEAKPHWGGHTHSRSDSGFVFDEGPHVSFDLLLASTPMIAQGLAYGS